MGELEEARTAGFKLRNAFLHCRIARTLTTLTPPSKLYSLMQQLRGFSYS